MCCISLLYHTFSNLLEEAVNTQKGTLIVRLMDTIRVNSMKTYKRLTVELYFVAAKGSRWQCKCFSELHLCTVTVSEESESELVGLREGC